LALPPVLAPFAIYIALLQMERRWSWQNHPMRNRWLTLYI
jgi:hypothetical protein